MKYKTVPVSILSALLALPALADFSYQETTRITGGSMVRMMKMVPGGGKALDPQTSQVYLKGSKLATVTQENISIIDLDAETMTSVDMNKKTFAVITFQEMAQALEAAKAKMEAELKKQNRGQQADVDMSFSVKVNETGQRKRISGYDTKEMEMLMEMQVSGQQNPGVGAMQFDISMWMTPDIDGYDQVRQFYLRMSQKMDWHPRMAGLASAMSMQPGMSQGMAEMMKEVQKLEGVPSSRSPPCAAAPWAPWATCPASPTPCGAAAATTAPAAAAPAMSSKTKPTGPPATKPPAPPPAPPEAASAVSPAPPPPAPSVASAARSRSPSPNPHPNHRPPPPPPVRPAPSWK